MLQQDTRGAVLIHRWHRPIREVCNLRSFDTQMLKAFKFRGGAPLTLTGARARNVPPFHYSTSRPTSSNLALALALTG